MTSKNVMRITVVAFALGGLCFFGQDKSQAQSAQQLIPVTGVTKPSVESKLGLNMLAVIREIPVTKGQDVKKGDLLVQQDDRQEQAELEALTLEANSTVEIQATEADLKVKEVQLKRYEELSKRGSSSPLELEEAQVKVVYAKAQVDLAKLKQETKKLEAKKQGVRVEQMALKSPIDGRIERIDVSVGEVTDPQKPFMTVVKVDPLWVEFYLPTSQSQKLQIGQTLEVRYHGEEKWMPAKVWYRSPVAQAAAGMQELQLELPNPQRRDAGQQVDIKLPPQLGQPGAAPAAAVLPPAQ